MMLPGLPPNYVDVAKALVTRGAVNVIGVVVDVFGGAFKSQGTSFCITFTIKDCNLDNGHTWDGLKIKYFKDSETLLPPVKEGDVVLVRDLWVKLIEGRSLAVASQLNNIPWAVFRPDRDPISHGSALTGPIPFEPTYKEKAFASSLLAVCPNSFRAISTSKPDFGHTSVSRSTSNAQLKFSLLKDVKDRQYVDLIGEIVKIHDNDSEKAALYLTDYTSNENFFCYASDNDDNPNRGREGDEFNYLNRPKTKWNGPSGQMTVQITLWEPHASSVRERFKANDIVRLKNVRIKGSRVEGGILEGVLHTNRDNPRAANVFPVDFSNDPRVHQLIGRKEEFWKAHPRKSKRKTDEDPEPVSKKAKKKQRVKAQQKKEAGQTSLGLNKRDAVSTNIVPGVPTSMRHQTLEDIVNNDSHLNDSPEGIRYRLPFQNLCYLSTVRVVDFYPPLLEEFAVLQEHVSVGYDKKHDPDTSRTYQKWEWRFCLLVESAASSAPGQPKQRTKLWVSNSSSEYLLQCSALNLRKNPSRLEELRERLFLLWGDLEEKKREALHSRNDKQPLDLGPISSRPFNCCIKEYGIRCSHPRTSNDPDVDGSTSTCIDGDCFGWERRFGLDRTTIHV
ncbi:hypothetical protein BDW59DRAFT_38385 [Aspergillus cavernicola]|uniref:Protection of telomeres protein 1 n=1 Tax=Aspergillus cavernicola TaxID=176166 RepID=A0ABR4INQ1_9EURO